MTEFGATPNEIENLKAQALAEMEGSNTITEETVQTEEPQPVMEDSEEPEVEFEADEDSSDEPKPEKTEDEIRKEVEKELKKKYYSKLNKAQREAEQLRQERDALRSNGYDEDQIDAIKKVARAEIKEAELSRIEKAERSTFLKKYSPEAKELKGIEEIKSDFPNMSWEAARKMYLAEHNPSALVQTKSPNLSVQGTIPRGLVEKPSLDDKAELLRQATIEAEIMAGHRR